MVVWGGPNGFSIYSATAHPDARREYVSYMLGYGVVPNVHFGLCSKP